MDESEGNAALSRKDAVLRICEVQSHELVSALAATREFIATVLDGLVGPIETRQQELLRAATACLDDSRTALETLVTVTQFESQRICIDLRDVDSIELIQCVVADGRRLSQARELRFAFDYDVDLPAMRADRGLMLELLNKLVLNAIHLSRAGGLITVSATADVDRSGYLRFSIVTDGKYDDAFLAGAFDLFQCALQNDSSGGLMLALVACRELIELHGGEIWVESRDGEGTAFVFTIPCASDKENVKEIERLEERVI